MKKLYILALVAVVAMASCGRNYTCPVYSKANAAGQPEQASIKNSDEQKGKM